MTRQHPETALEPDLGRQADWAHLSRLSTAGYLAASVAHELNQPLCSISLYANACLNMLQPQENVPKEVVSWLKDLSRQALRAGEIVRRLRSLVRKREPLVVPVNISELIRNVFASTEYDARLLSVKVRLAPGDHLPAVLADPIQIEQVLLNLVRNALEAMQGIDPDRRILTIRALTPEEHTVEVQVHNVGPPIPKEILERVFDPFYTAKDGGLGLGLFLSRVIIESHHGHLDAASSTNGTTFRFRIPARRAD